MSGFWRDLWRSFTHPTDPYAPGNIPIEDFPPPPEDWMAPYDEDEDAGKVREDG
jgi:hypothetical protein